RLKAGSLLVARPAAHAGPDDGYDASETGGASDHPVENAYGCVRSASRRLHLRESWARQVVKTEQDEQRAHADTEMDWGGPSQSGKAKGNAQRAADNERHEALHIQQMPQLPDRIALDEQRIPGDERGRLLRRERIEPDGGSDHGKSEA